MIQIHFFQNPAGELLGFEIFGHSGTAEAGNDVVCAAVSSAAYMAANTVTDVLMADAEATVRDGEMSLRIGQKDAALCRSLLKGLKLHLIALEEQYPDHINVSYTEV